ncbi:hypothetical protein RFI_15451, partial [Reticulomyxa filosa]
MSQHVNIPSKVDSSDEKQAINLKITVPNNVKLSEVNVLVSIIRSDLRKPLEGMTISALNVMKDPVTLDSNLSVEEGMKVLTEKHIRCAPVWDETKKGFIGVLDIRDSLKHAVKVYRQNKSLALLNQAKEETESISENGSSVLVLPSE